MIPKGFRVGAIASGVKKNSALDLAAIASQRACTAAGVFTSNAFKAAPVLVDQQILESKDHKNLHGVIINSGCANAVTGSQGLENARSMVLAFGKEIGAPEPQESALVMSTGVIGQHVNLEKITKSIPNLVKNNMGQSAEHWHTAAQGIMTTDTFPKLESVQFQANGHEYSVCGIGKGAGMIAPNMATLLSCIVTDAPVASSLLQSALRRAVDSSFNMISVDGDMSTNDTVVALANGAAGGPEIVDEDSGSPALEEALTQVSQSLAKSIVRDGEGATKFVTVEVSGAASDADARTTAAAIANSMLVKTALFGMDANWGRIACAVGYCGARVRPESTSISFGTPCGDLELLVRGEPVPVDEDRAAQVLAARDLVLKVDLGLGYRQAKFWTCDLSHEYVSINGDYRS